MKRFIITVIFITVSLVSYSQSLPLDRLAILFSQDDLNGSARFTAMSGAFGALGGDISTINVNPAGIAVFNNSAFTASFNNRNTAINASFGDANFNDRQQIITNTNSSNLSQAGAVLVFDSAYEDSNWKKFAIGFNYRVTKDFSDSFFASGNEGFIGFDRIPEDRNNPQSIFDLTEGQDFSTDLNGEITEINLAFSAVHLNKLYVGASLNFYDLNFFQQSTLTEFNSNNNGDTLEVDLFQDNNITGSGFSANFGFIYKTDINLRLGLSYQTPTYYSEIIQNSNYDQDSDINIGETAFFQNGQEVFRETNPEQLIAYSLKTPSKVTASAAYIFGKKGLLSLDYINRNYTNLQFTEPNFNAENDFFRNDLRNTHAFNIGTEWRFDRFSVRGGYRFEQNPFIDAFDSDNLKGYSLGAGYKFNGLSFNLAYTNNNRTDFYDFNQVIDVNPAELDIDNRIITASVTINL